MLLRYTVVSPLLERRKFSGGTCIFCRPRHIQGGPRKVKPTTILLVTFECVGKIQ